jgi:hypothetical protein
MAWWFLILACSAGAVVWVAVSLFIRVRAHLKEIAAKEALAELEREREARGS